MISDNNLLSRFASLAADAAAAGALSRLTFSRPRESDTPSRVVATLYRSGSGDIMVRADTTMPDGKNIRKNYDAHGACEYFASLSEQYRQGNLTVGAREAQYIVSKKGKVTVSGEGAVRAEIASSSPVELGGADDKKQYFWAGDEAWLIALGISDKNGRIHDKRRSKFRQINRFTELLDDIYGELPQKEELRVCDLCCGKSYLSFAVYEYLTKKRGRTVTMLCVDRKADVIEYCGRVAHDIGADGLNFVCGDVSDESIYNAAFGSDAKIDLTVSLHACDLATDIVLRRAVKMDSRVILSTPCCHHELYGKIRSDPLSFITSHSMLSQKLTDAVTDGLRVKMLEVEGYRTSTVELIDPDETPKNVMIRAVKRKRAADRERMISEYNAIIEFLGLSGSYYDIY